MDSDLLQAAKRGDRNEVVRLLSTHKPNDGVDLEGNSPLHMASLHGSVECTRALITAKADINAKNKLGFSPIHGAVQKVHLDVIKLLIKEGAHLQRTDAMDFSVLHWLLAKWRPQNADAAAKLLLTCNPALANERTDAGDAPLHVAKDAACIETLISHGADIDAINKVGCPPDFRWLLCQAILEDDQSDFEAALLCGKEGKTPLMVASAKGWEDAVLQLLRHNANLNHKHGSLDAIELATRQYKHGTVRLLEAEKAKREDMEELRRKLKQEQERFAAAEKQAREGAEKKIKQLRIEYEKEKEQMERDFRDHEAELDRQLEQEQAKREAVEQAKLETEKRAQQFRAAEEEAKRVAEEKIEQLRTEYEKKKEELELEQARREAVEQEQREAKEKAQQQAESQEAERRAAIGKLERSLATDAFDVGGELSDAVSTADQVCLDRDCEPLVAARLQLRRNKEYSGFRVDSGDIDGSSATEIGHGSRSTVQKVRYGDVDAAAKCFLSTDARALMKEVLILADIRHPNIVTLYGFYSDSGSPEQTCLLLEFAPCGSLRSYIDANQTLMSDPVKRKLLVGVLRGMTGLHEHSPPILHRNLNSENVLVFDRLQAKISGFGHSTGGSLYDNESAQQNTSVTPQTSEAHAAPETLQPDCAFNTACDVYSFGVIVTEVATRGRCTTLLGMKDEERRSFLGIIAARCCAQQPDNRPPFSEIMREGWFTRQLGDIPRIDVNWTSDWNKIQPVNDCLGSIKKHLSSKLHDVDLLLRDVEAKLNEVLTSPRHDTRDMVKHLNSDRNQLAALIAYTHDFEMPERSGNLYYEVNNALRAPTESEKATTVRIWGEFMHYIMLGLNQLPNHCGVVFRAVTNTVVAEEYTLWRSIKWQAFTSTAMNERDAKSMLSDPSDGIVFRINITRGKIIDPISFYPESEVLLWPGQEFSVIRSVHQEGEYQFIDLQESHGQQLVF